jgi:hypothetical protein
MGSVADLDALYTSAPIFDEDDARDLRAASDEELIESTGVLLLGPEQFDAAVLDALIHI